MLNSLLLYITDTQREGRFITGHIRSRIILNALAAFFFIIAFIAALIASSIYLAKEIGAGPASLIIAGSSFLLGAIMLVVLALTKRRANYKSPTGTSPLNAVSATQAATQTALTVALAKRPYLTLAATIALGFIVTKSTIQKK